VTTTTIFWKKQVGIYLGLGLMNTQDIGYAAFLASISESGFNHFFGDTPDILENFRDENIDLPIVKDVWSCLKALDSFTNRTMIQIIPRRNI
jgi:hypothetical protein